jgi:Ca2+-binding EF-hand superfamily protein
MAMNQDAYYVPPHLSDPFTKAEMKAYVDVYKDYDAADGDADGFIEIDALPHLMAAIGEKHTAAKEAELIAECDPNGTGNLGFLDVLRLMARFRYRRDPFGGKRAITDDLPLPVRVSTEYDKPCLQHPDRRAQMSDPTNPTVTVMKMIFNRYDTDGSGTIEMQEVVEILAAHGLVFDEEELEATFHRFDVDRGGTLDFGEFCEMMADLKAETAIVEARAVSYEVPPALKQHFSAQELADLRVNFGMFDVDGGGSIAASEIKAVLDDMGLNPTEEQVVSPCLPCARQLNLRGLKAHCPITCDNPFFSS